ncbi:conjugal transfer protein TraO [Massilia sp. TWP1-3-3]|uniref:conjugal transfer protein TraO n=1 Tax=Massilia sp. TWP1-3-3 TaxID=2804573 RepID=UPI003CF59720
MSSVQSDVGRQGKVTAAAIVVACVAGGYVAVTWLTDSSRKQSQVSAVQTQSRGTTTQESEHYSQVLDRYNREKASVAEQTGDSYLSVMSSRANSVASPSAAQTPAQAPAQAAYQPPPQQVVYYPQQPAQQAYHQDPQRAKEVAEQTQGLMANWAPTGHSLARTSTDAADYAKSLARPSEPLQAQQGAAAAATANLKVVEDFAMVPALLETDIDTDENSMVRASIPSGPYAGAELFALGYKRLTNTVDMTFTFMKWQGRSYKVTAKAVDQTSMRTSLSGDVNNRYFSRILLPAIGMGLGRAGQLYEQASTQNIITPLGGVVQTYPAKPSASAVMGTVVGGIGSQAGQVLANDAANMPLKQVLIPKKTTIGIQFVGPVLASDDMAAGAVGSAQQGEPVADALSALSLPAAQPPRTNPPTALQGAGAQQGHVSAGQLQQYVPPPLPLYSQ